VPEEDHHRALPGLLRLPAHAWRNLNARQRVVVAMAGALLATGGLVGIAALMRAGERDAAREARQERAARRAEVRRLARDQSPRSAPLRTGSSPARQLEGAITADARARVAAGQLDGPVQRTVCRRDAGEAGTPAGGSRRYRCLAVSSAALGTVSGQEFIAQVDLRRRRLVWCHTNPAPLADTSQVSVPLPPECTRP
jgi:hypothetical protein